MTVVTLYGKPGCHLCDEARRAIGTARATATFELREIDITLDPALHLEYGERIPVVSVDGVETFQFFVDPAALVKAVGRVEP